MHDQSFFEIHPIGEIAVGLQQIAKQASRRGDREYPGILRILLAHGSQESRALCSVFRVEVDRARQAKLQLGGVLDFFIQVICDIFGLLRQRFQSLSIPAVRFWRKRIPRRIACTSVASATSNNNRVRKLMILAFFVRYRSLPGYDAWDLPPHCPSIPVHTLWSY